MTFSSTFSNGIRRFRNVSKAFLFLAGTFFAVSIFAQSQATEIETIRQRILTYEIARGAKSADAIRGLYNASVSNSDLNAMARAYATPGHALYHDAGLAAAFRSRLADYCKRDPQKNNSNWWFSQIPDPYYLARACLLMGDALTLADYNTAKAIINRGGLMSDTPPYKSTSRFNGPVGVNTIWIYGPEIDNGILKYRLLKDSLFIKSAVDYLKLGTKIESGGDQQLADWSYPFHAYLG
jgi:hypothetical protein